MIEGAEARALREHNARTALAYNTAVLAQVAFRAPRRMPRLQRLMAKPQGAKPRSIDDQWRAMRVIAKTRARASGS